MTGTLRDLLLPLLLLAPPRQGEDFPDPPDRDAAAQARWALARLEDPSDPRAREAGARILLGLEDAAYPALLGASGSPSGRVRARAFDLLASLGREIPEGLRLAGLRDGNRAVRAAALRALRPRGASPSEILPLLQDRFHDVRIEALRAALRFALAGRADRALAEAVRARALDPDVAVREEARRILLGWPAEPPGAGGLLDPGDPANLAATLKVVLEAEDPPSWAGRRLRRIGEDEALPLPVRRGASAAALLCGERSEAAVLEAVEGSLRAEDLWVADGCTRALRLVREAAAPPLSRGLADRGLELSRFRIGLGILASGDAGGFWRLRLLEALAPGEPIRSDARRAEVIRSLPERSVEAGRLRRLLASEAGEEARAAAVEALARAEGRAALPLLIERLADPAPGVRRAAGLAAAKLGGEEVEAVLVEALAAEEDAETLRAFVEEFPRTLRAPRIRESLCRLALDDRERVRSGAWGALGSFKGDPEAVAALAGAFAKEAARGAAAGPTEREVLRARRAWIVNAIALVGGEDARRFLAGLVEALGPIEEERDVTKVAVARLAQGRGSRGLLRSILDSGACRRVRIEAALALAPLGDEDASELLEEGFRNFDVELRLRALEALAARGEGSPLWFLADVAGDGSEGETVRERAMEALARFADRREIFDLLRETARSAPDLAARLAAVRALGLSRRGDAAAALRELARSPEVLPPDEDGRRELTREIALALAGGEDPANAEILASLAFEEPARRWRDSLRAGRRSRSFATRSGYDVEETALEALARLGPAGEAVLRRRIAGGFEEGKASLADPSFLVLAARRLREALPDLARRMVRLASRTFGEDAPKRLEAILDHAEAALADGAYGEAAEAYDRALAEIRERRIEPREARAVIGEEDPESGVHPFAALRADAALARGLAAFGRGEEIEGARAFDEAEGAARPDLRATLRVALRIAERPGGAARAVEIAARAAERASRDREAREALGWCRLRAGEAGAAAACFEAALALPDAGKRGEGPARFGLAASLLALGRDAEAREALEAAILSEPALRAAAERSPFLERLRAEGGSRPSPAR